MAIKYKFVVLLLMITFLSASIGGGQVYTYARPNRNYENILEELNNEYTVVAESICLESITLLKLGMLTLIIGILFVYTIYLSIQDLQRNGILDIYIDMQ